MRKSKITLAFVLMFFAITTMAQDAWKLIADTINPANYYGITAANGMIGIVSSPEPLKVKNVILAGTYDMYGRGRVSNLLNGFNLLNLRLQINGKGVNLSNIRNFRQQLDMKSGLFTGSFTLPGNAEVKYTYCALRQLPFSVMMDVEITALKEVDFVAINIMETPDALRDAHFTFNEINRSHVSIPLMTSVAATPTGKSKLCATTSFMFPEGPKEQPDVVHENPDNNLHQMKFSKHVAQGVSYRFSVVGTTISSAIHSDPVNEAERLTIFASLEGHDRLLNMHRKAWAELWKSDIEIEGDAQAQQDIRSMLYHLYAFSCAGSGLSVSPMGLSGLGYNGHVFWDADIWMYPVLLVMHPEIARSHIDYRFSQLNDARRNAFSHGYKGAMYPWESAASGNEETPIWALSGPFEHHVTACVGIAAWNYYQVTGDKEWLSEKGWPIISETANFWASRVEMNANGKFEIKNVVAADEWAENVDNNAFTNAAAKINLQLASQAALVLGLKPDANWKKVADGLLILQLPNGVTREHATYNGENIKQADVNLLAYPLGIITDMAQIRKDLEYYETRVPVAGTPAMTQAIFSLLYARLGNAGKASYFFKDAYIPNLLPPFRVIAEFKGGTNPYFATGAGGVLQAVMMGFGGLEISPKGIVQKKGTLPTGWKSLKINYYGKN
jgi:protein-glucosylgalactosylhydroxylysine glucosidase